MREAASLAEVPLDALLGWRLDGADRLRLVDIERRLDELRRAGDLPRWTYDERPRSATPGATPRPAFGTVLGVVYKQNDWLELSLDLWYDADTAVLLTTTAEVASFCPIDHNVHYVAEEEWVVTAPAELVLRASDAVGVLAAWAATDRSPREWRQLHRLPDR